MAPAVRLVRCPKCQQLLQESADVPIYRCGGCGAILQAKNRKNSNKGQSELLRNGDAPIDRLENNSWNTQLDLPMNSDTQTDVPCKVVNNGRSELLENSDAPTDRLDDNAHNGQSDLPMIVDAQTDEFDKTVENGQTNRNGDSPIEGLDNSLGSKRSRDPDLQLHLHDGDNLQIGKIDYASDDKGSTSSKKSIMSSEETIPPSSMELFMNLKSVAEQDIFTHRSTEHNLADKNICDNGHAEETPTCNGQERESTLDESIDKYSESNGGFDQDRTMIEPNSRSNEEPLLRGAVNLQVQLHGKDSQTVGEESEEGKIHGNSNSGSSKLDESIVKETSSEVVTQRPIEGVLPKDHVVLSDKRPEQLRSRISRRDRMMSRETIASTEYADPNSEFSDVPPELDDSPPRRNYHVYDGSVSSLDDIENHSPDRNMHLLNHLNEQADHNFSKEKLRKEKWRMNDLTHSNYELRHPEGDFLSNLEMEQYHKKQSRWGRNGMLEPIRRGYTGRQSTRSERAALPPRVPIDHRTVQPGYESGGTLKGYRSFQHAPSFYFNDSPHYPEPDKMKLLRMVYELEDQLKRSCELEDMGTGRASLGATWQEKDGLMYQYHRLPEEEDLAVLNLPGYGGRYMVENNWPRHYASSQRPLPRERMRSHQLNHSRWHRFPSEWRHSEPLPRPTSRNESLYSMRTGRSAYAPCNSLPSSPQQYMDPEYLAWDSESKSEDQMYRFQEERRYFRERTDSMKSHFRPKAGGAPLIACYCCSQVLQLPEDFLVLKKRCHRLKCGACSAVLKFSLQSRVHIVPHMPKVSNPPPSEADDLDEARYGRNFSSASHAHHSSQTERMSYYDDDYGVFVSQSYSTEGHMDDMRTSRNSSSTQRNRRKSFGPSNSRDKGKKPMIGSADSLEIEEIAHRTGSPLHQLMGYMSVSQVFRGREQERTRANSSSHPNP